jgi:hypothetical protein
VQLNRHPIGVVAPAQEVFSVRSMTEDVGGPITVQAVVSQALHKLAAPTKRPGFWRKLSESARQLLGSGLEEP